MDRPVGGTTLGAPPRTTSGTVLGGAPPRSASSSIDSSVSTSSASAAKKRKKRTKADGMSSGSRYVIKTERDWIEGMSSEEEEDEEDYKRGGYHPVNIGNIFNQRYKIVSKLGWGHFSTVWLANDMKTNATVALKIVKSAKHYTEAARDEVAILNKVTENDPNNNKCIVHLLDSFDHSGPNGTHVCMAFENLGCNLLTVIRMYKYKGLPIPLVKIFTKQMLIALDYLHRRCQIIHTDLKPENVLLVKTPTLVKTAKLASKAKPDNADRMSVDGDKAEDRNGDDSEDENTGNSSRNAERDQATEAELATLPKTKEQLTEAFGDQSYMTKVVDLGNACWVDKHFTDDVQTRQYRSPEVLLGQQWGPPIDVWSMGCIVFELLTGDMLFEPKSGRHFNKNDDHLAQMIELCGRMPRSMTQSGKYASEYFNRRGELRNIRKLKPWPLAEVLEQKYQFTEKDAKAISSFVMPMLEYDPDKRATARQCLQHEWISEIDVTRFETAFS